MYGILIEPLLFYLKLRKDLEVIGLKVKHYGTCLANNNVDDTQMTITWHEDEPKLSHSNRDIVDTFIEWTKETYKDVTKLNPSRGKIHDYLAMTLDYTTPGEVKSYMKYYIEKYF